MFHFTKIEKASAVTLKNSLQLCVMIHHNRFNSYSAIIACVKKIERRKNCSLVGCRFALVGNIDGLLG